MNNCRLPYYHQQYFSIILEDDANSGDRHIEKREPQKKEPRATEADESEARRKKSQEEPGRPEPEEEAKSNREISRDSGSGGGQLGGGNQ